MTGPDSPSHLPSSATVIDLQQLRHSCANCALHLLCVPGGLDADGLNRLEGIVRRRRLVRRGERLFRMGDPLTSVYVASEGAFKTVQVTEVGDAVLLGFHLPGELMGLDALGSGMHRCEAVALTDAQLCELPCAQLDDVARELPGLQQQLLRVIGQSMGRDHDHMAVLMRRQASERLAAFLHGLSERYARIGLPPLQFTLPMSREDIAQYVGLALETVSRGFSRLQDDGVIAVQGRRIGIVNPGELERLAHGIVHSLAAPQPLAR